MVILICDTNYLTHASIKNTYFMFWKTAPGKSALIQIFSININCDESVCRMCICLYIWSNDCIYVCVYMYVVAIQTY